MKYNKIYEVDSAFIVDDSIKWVPTGSGEYILATKGGKKYFVKRNMHVRYPSAELPDSVYKLYKAQADAIQKKQKRLSALMKGLKLSDHIVVENENFWDDDNMFVTITDFIPDGLSEEYDYSVLSLEAFLKLAIQAAEALDKLHAHGVIHGDLKTKNFVVVNSDGKYLPYLIDFDTSYPADEVPERDPESEEFGGSEGYQSPEIIAYGKGLCEKDEITYATDIFSLGVIFHKWWTNSFPAFDLERGSVGAAVYLDRAVTISKKFDVRIGDKCGTTLKSLINWMFAKNPADRPTAKQVVEVLADNSEVPEEYHAGNDMVLFDTELWETHRLVAELLPVTELKKLGVKSFKRINEGGGSMSLKYRVVTDGSAEKTLTIADICEAGYVKIKGAEVDEPWEGHLFEFEPSDVIVKKGYAKIKRVQMSFRKRYLITTLSGRVIDKGYEWLVSEGLAHPKRVEVEADTPWPEHGAEYNTANMAQLGVKSISRMEVGGEHRYKIVYDEIVDGKNRTSESVPVSNIKLMGFIK